MSRIPLDHKTTPLVRIAEIYSKRRYGAVLQPGLALLHNRKVLVAMIGYENKVARWNALDQTVKAVAVLAAAAEIGCGWCLDYGFWASFHQGVDPVKLREITDWEGSTVYNAHERAAIRYAVAMTKTPPEVTDDMVADLRTRFSDAELVELTATVALENQRSRINTALGMTGQGFRDRCDLPATMSAEPFDRLRTAPVEARPFGKLRA